MLRTDRNMRVELLEQTQLLAEALKVDKVSKLTGTEADLASPIYQRIKEQLIQARHLYPSYRFLYLMSRRADGTVIFLVDSEPADSANLSPPGQSYQEATLKLTEIFTTGMAITEGPVEDRWGTWVSSLVPLYHPQEETPMAVLGIDVDATHWRAQTLRPLFPLALFTLALMLILAFAPRLLRKRAAKSALFGPPEAWLTALLGLIITLFATQQSITNEARVHRQAFQRLAMTQTRIVAQFLHNVRDNQLEGLARFFMGSRFVDRPEFHVYAAFLGKTPIAQIWCWAPYVPATNLLAFQNDVRSGGWPDYTAWQMNELGEHVPVTERSDYFPVCYIEPQTDNESAMGLDLGSEPRRRAALETARRTDLITATDPVILLRGQTNETGILIFRPVWGAVDTNALQGFAVAVLRLDQLLNKSLGLLLIDSPLDMELQQRQLGSAPLVLDGTDPEIARIDALPDHSGHPRFYVPIFAFGKTYAVAAWPNARFTHAYPRLVGWRVLLGGLTLSTALTLLVGTMSRRREALEQLVSERTAALRASESSYHGLFNSIQQAIYILDLQGRFLDVNDGAVTMYGYTRSEFVGQTPEFLSAPGRNNLEVVAQALARTAKGEPQYFVFWGLRKNGEVFPKDVWLYQGTYFGQSVVIAVASDISDRHRAEEEKIKLQAQLQQAQKLESIGRLAGGVAHDFNNMLQVILGNASLGLGEIAPNHPVHEYLEEIQTSATRSADLTRQLLAFASRQTVKPRVIDLNDTIAGMLKMLHRLIGEDIQLAWIPGSDLGPVKMDPSQIDQILANLAVNARDAIRGVGTVTIETSGLLCQDEKTQQRFGNCRMGEYVLLTVRDTGRGMDEETKAHIFEPFYTTKESGKGVGLGLATVFGIVKQNHGFIEVKSAPGEGSTFTIGLPKSERPMQQECVDPAVTPRQGGHETLLLVEDEQSILRLGQEALQRLGYRILTADNPTRALDLARHHNGDIHLLITDVVMPDMNGRELAQLLSALIPGLQCLFMSGYTADIIARRGVLDERVHFLQKPFTVDALASKIRAILNERPKA